MDWGLMLLGFGLGILFCQVMDCFKAKVEKKIEEVEADIVRDETLKALDKVKEDLVKRK